MRSLPIIVVVLTAIAVLVQLFMGFEIVDLEGRVQRSCAPIGEITAVLPQAGDPVTRADLACVEQRITRQTWLGLTVAGGAVAWAVVRQLSRSAEPDRSPRQHTSTSNN